MDQHRAEVIINACHAAWNVRDLARMFRFFSPNIVYTCNTETSEKVGPVRFVGREAMRSFLEPALAATESVCVVEALHFDGVRARTTISLYMKHIATGLDLSGQYRQVYRFDDNGLVAQLEEYHDAAKLAAFWRMVQQAEAQVSPR